MWVVIYLQHQKFKKNKGFFYRFLQFRWKSSLTGLIANFMEFKDIFSKKFIFVILISIPGALIADILKIPLAWFLGPMLFTSLASLLGLELKMPKIILSLILILLGLYIGNYIDKNLFTQMNQWVWTSFIMLVYIILSVLFVSKYLQKF